jgi:hypothetical protein
MALDVGRSASFLIFGVPGSGCGVDTLRRGVPAAAPACFFLCDRTAEAGAGVEADAAPRGPVVGGIVEDCDCGCEAASAASASASERWFAKVF